MKKFSISTELYEQHRQLTRRYFMKLGITSPFIFNSTNSYGNGATLNLNEDQSEEKEYLTPADEFETIERGNPLPYKLPREKRLEIGMERETWKLNVVPDPESNSEIENPLSRANNNALDFKTLMSLAENKSVKFMKVMTCNNLSTPLGMGLWEGVPLRDVIWLAKPKENIRRVFYYGHHNNDPKQMFRSSLPIGRVLEDPPGDHPVILCYKLNNQWLSGERGGPVRMIVPEAYGFKSVKWLKSVVLTNEPAANDTYADGNNDIDSWMKSMSLFVETPTRIKSGQPIPITGMAQVGVSGLSKVQIWISPVDKKWPKEDPYFTKAPWKEASILPPPKKWGGELPSGKLPQGVRFFDKDGIPKHWPMRYTISHWATSLNNIKKGKYNLYCRTIDNNGIAQPMPRPFKKSGRNSIDVCPIEVYS